MKNKQTIFKINELSFNLKKIEKKLFNDNELNESELLIITESLDEINLTSQKTQNECKNIFLKEGVVNICDDIKNLYGRIEEIEDKRHLKDDGILSKLYEISFKEDYLELNFSNLNPCDIEMILNVLDEEINDILNQKPFNEQIINPIVEKIKNKLIDLHFRYDFPIVEELDENKNSYAHRLILMANEIKEKDPKMAKVLINKIDDFMDLVWISKMFLYKDSEKAQRFFEQLNPDIKEKIEKIIWQIKGENLNKINDKKFILPAALMNYIADEINA